MHTSCCHVIGLANHFHDVALPLCSALFYQAIPLLLFTPRFKDWKQLLRRVGFATAIFFPPRFCCSAVMARVESKHYRKWDCITHWLVSGGRLILKKGRNLSRGQRFTWNTRYNFRKWQVNAGKIWIGLLVMKHLIRSGDACAIFTFYYPLVRRSSFVSWNST